MRVGLILLITVLLLQNCRCPEVKINPVEFPQGHKSNPRKNLLVTTTATNKIYIGSKEIPFVQLDSVLKMEINDLKDHVMDTITVVINADTATNYGVVFSVMKSAKKIGARVVANVQ
jgi:biopolymer transport protein ExbD